MTYLALSEILANVPYYVPLILLLMINLDNLYKESDISFLENSII